MDKSGKGMLRQTKRGTPRPKPNVGWWTYQWSSIPSSRGQPKWASPNQTYIQASMPTMQLQLRQSLCQPSLRLRQRHPKNVYFRHRIGLLHNGYTRSCAIHVSHRRKLGRCYSTRCHLGRVFRWVCQKCRKPTQRRKPCRSLCNNLGSSLCLPLDR